MLSLAPWPDSEEEARAYLNRPKRYQRQPYIKMCKDYLRERGLK